MITTLKLCTTAQDFPYQRQYSSVFRFAYERASEGLSQIDIRAKVRDIWASKSDTKTGNNQESLNSWIMQCAILDAQAQYAANKTQVERGLRKTTRVVWGGKSQFWKHATGKITKQQWRELRLRPMKLQGEKLKKSNRLFDFSRLATDHILIYKPTKDIRLEIPVSCPSPNQQRQLEYLQQNIGNIAIQVQLQAGNICLAFEQEIQPMNNLLTYRKLGIDQNPNYIGVSIVDFRNGKEILIKSQTYKWTEQARQDPDKRDHETKEIVHSIMRLARHYRVSEIGVERLTMGATDAGFGRHFNRLVNNQWNRGLFTQTLAKQTQKYGMDFHEVNAAYSSTIGNVLHRSQHDPAASAWEVARRTYYKYQKSLCVYPPLDLDYIKSLNLWKKDGSDVSEITSWKDLHRAIKKAKLRYRVQLNDLSYVASRLSSQKSGILVYTDFTCLH